jgi:hypothetical protein
MPMPPARVAADPGREGSQAQGRGRKPASDGRARRRSRATQPRDADKRGRKTQASAKSRDADQRAAARRKPARSRATQASAPSRDADQRAAEAESRSYRSIR